MGFENLRGKTANLMKSFICGLLSYRARDLKMDDFFLFDLKKPHTFPRVSSLLPYNDVLGCHGAFETITFFRQPIIM